MCAAKAEQPAESVAVEPVLVGYPHLYNGKYRMTDRTLAYAKDRPSKMAAWVLREIIVELIERRSEAEHSDGSVDQK